jgi:hypothetical protein
MSAQGAAAIELWPTAGRLAGASKWRRTINGRCPTWKTPDSAYADRNCPNLSDCDGRSFGAGLFLLPEWRSRVLSMLPAESDAMKLWLAGAVVVFLTGCATAPGPATVEDQAGVVVMGPYATRRWRVVARLGGDLRSLRDLANDECRAPATDISSVVLGPVWLFFRRIPIESGC